MHIVGFHSLFADFTVWDNDGLYALVTVVSIAFTIALIVVVMRKSREHDAVNRGTVTESPVRMRAAQLRAASEQAMIAAQKAQPTATEPPATPSTSTHNGQ